MPHERSDHREPKGSECQRRNLHDTPSLGNSCERGQIRSALLIAGDATHREKHDPVARLSLYADSLQI